MKLKRATVFLTTVTLGLGISACSRPGGQDGTSNEAVQTIKIGLAQPLSGPQAGYQADLNKFFEYGVEAANKELKSEGFRLEVAAEDTAAAPAQGIVALQKLASVERTPVIITGYSAVVQAMAPLAKDLNVALVNIGGGDPALEKASPNLINFWPLQSIPMPHMAKYVVNSRGLKTAATIYVNNASGIGPAKLFESEFEKAGGRIVADATVAPGTPDATSAVAKIMAQKPQFVYVQALVPESPVIFKALEGYGTQLGTYDGIANSIDVRKASGNAMDGLIYANTAKAISPALQALIDRFKKETGRDPSGPNFDYYYYDAPFMIADIVRRLSTKGEPITGENLLKALHAETSVKTPLLGESHFNDDLAIIAPVSIKQIIKTSDPLSADKTVEDFSK
jgi:branched-chain amino acid transport system substrate-binding protein